MADLKNVITSLAGSEGNPDNDPLQAQDTTTPAEQDTHVHVDIPGAGVVGLPKALGEHISNISKGIYDHFNGGATPLATPTGTISAQHTSALDVSRRFIANSAIGHSVESTMPKVADALNLHPDETVNSPTYEAHKNQLIAPDELITPERHTPIIEAARGALQGVGSLTSGESMATIAATAATGGLISPAVPAIGKMISLGFSVQSANDLVRKAPELLKLAPGSDEFYQALGRLGFDAANLRMMAKHAGSVEEAGVTRPEDHDNSVLENRLSAKDSVSVKIPGLREPIIVDRKYADAVSKIVHTYINSSLSSERGAVGPFGKKNPLNNKRLNAPLSPETVKTILDSHEENNGSTVDAKTGESEWGSGKYSVGADASRTVVLDHTPTAEEIQQFARQNKDYVIDQHEDYKPGTWNKKDDGTHHLDVAQQVDSLDEAQSIGQRERQLTIQHMQSDSPHGTDGNGEIPVDYPITNALKDIYGNRDFGPTTKTGFMSVDGTFIPIEGTMHINAVVRAMQEVKANNPKYQVPDLKGTGLDFLQHAMDKEGFIRLRERSGPGGRELAVTIPNNVRPEQLDAVDKIFSEMKGNPTLYVERATLRPGDDPKRTPETRRIETAKPGALKTAARELGVYNSLERNQFEHQTNRRATPAEVKQFEPETKPEVKGNQWVPVSPAEYKVQQKNNPHAASLTSADVNEMANNKIFRLNIDGKSAGIYYYVTPDGEIGGIINNGSHRGIAAEAALKHGVENGGNYLTAWETNGKLTDLYEKNGFKKVSSTPYDEETYGEPSEALKQSWRKSGWKDYEDYPEVARFEKPKETPGTTLEQEVQEMERKRKIESERLDSEQEERAARIAKHTKNLKDLAAIPDPKELKAKADPAFTDAQKAQTVADNDYVAKAKQQLGPDASASDVLRLASKFRDNPETAPGYGDSNSFVTKDKYEQAKQVLGKKITDASTKLNSAIPGGILFDPETMKAAFDIAAYHFEAGARTIGELGNRLLDEFGESIQPHIGEIFGHVSNMLNADGKVDPKLAAEASEAATHSVSNRRPFGDVAAKLGAEDPVKHNLMIGYDSINPDKVDNPKLKAVTTELQQKVADRISSYDILPTNSKNLPASEKLETFVNAAKDNLKYLYDKIPVARRAMSKQWYSTARQFAVERGKKYGYSTPQVAGVIAALSPQTPWEANLALADRMMQIVQDKGDFVADHKMYKKGLEISRQYDADSDTYKGSGEVKAVLNKIRGKSFNELKTPDQEAAWIRLYDETYNPQTYHQYGPDGTDKGEVKNLSGSPTKLAWQGHDPIKKALAIMQDGSKENISDNLGYAHKVRSFYGNILSPNHPSGRVTIDTHAVGAALMKMVSGDSPEVKDNFNSPSSKITGVKGTYPLYVEAYTRAAKELGVRPSELQSIVWEEIRDLFDPELKTPENIETINKMWADHKAGKLSIDELRDKVYKAPEMMRSQMSFLPRKAEMDTVGGFKVDGNSKRAIKLPPQPKVPKAKKLAPLEEEPTFDFGFNATEGVLGGKKSK